jgi:hypothetical protein
MKFFFLLLKKKWSFFFTVTHPAKTLNQSDEKSQWNTTDTNDLEDTNYEEENERWLTHKNSQRKKDMSYHNLWYLDACKKY